MWFIIKVYAKLKNVSLLTIWGWIFFINQNGDKNLIDQLYKAAAITIIGGADGPTSIYISSVALWQIFLLVILLLAFIVFGICRLIKNIKDKNKLKAILWSCVLFLLMTSIIIISVWNFIETRNRLKMLDFMYYNQYWNN